MTKREQAAASRLTAHPSAVTVLLCLAGFVSSLVLPCGAFALSPGLGSKLHLTDHSPSDQTRRTNGVQRRVPAAAAATTAAGLEDDKATGERKGMELRLLTWMEVENHVQREVAETGTAAVIVPVGATEQHGPNGLIGTDHMTAEAVARGISDATGALLAPSINYGMSHHHESFPGTVTLRPATFVAVMRDVASSLSKTGFTHVMFVNGHGGNVGPAFKAFADFAAEQQQDQEQGQGRGGQEKRRRGTDDESRVNGSHNGSGSGSRSSQTAAAAAASSATTAAAPVDGAAAANGGNGGRARVKLISWYAGRESSALAKELYGDEVGQHATPDEVAMTQHLFPESIKVGVELDPAVIKVAKELGGMTKRLKDEATGLSVMDVQDFRRRFPDGRMFSNPGLATPEHGRLLLEAAVRDGTEALHKFLNGQDLVEEAEMRAKRAAAMEAAAAAAAAGEGRKKADTRGAGGKAAFEPRRRWGDGGGGADPAAAEKKAFRPRPRWVKDEGGRRRDCNRGGGGGGDSGGAVGGGFHQGSAPPTGGVTTAEARSSLAGTAPSSR